MPVVADNVRSFFESLYDDGRPELRTAAPPPDEEMDAAVRCILGEERRQRRSLAGVPPQPDEAAVRWGAEMTYRAAQFLAYRDLPAELIGRQLTAACPARPSPAVCYGVDLTFRFLPDLARLVRTVSPEDPLSAQVKSWAQEWPLSSVGVPGIEPGSVEDFIGDAALRMLYVDRIMAAGDVSRLCDERVAAAVSAALGEFPQLSPRIAAALQRPKLEPS